MPVQIASSLDFTSLITNAGVFIAAVAATVAAIWGTVKKIKSSDDQPNIQKVIGGAMLDSTSILMWSESNREVASDIREMTNEMKELRFAMIQLRDALK